MELEARRASSADANAVLEILDEAAAWLRARGVQQSQTVEGGDLLMVTPA